MPASRQLLRVAADGEERLHRVHAGRVGGVAAPQRAGAATPGVETLL